ncbi:9200_t:CDS:10 [Dentiscutata erythropus]|uniref:AP-3 complex subunit delta n=1 Tax=Dentiscutata erythropus TaxID=1348616 RepID=A0A9N9HU56_9GLOM|nr:9200_t:CDS:10 [Dentiscutata erythropus]
MFEKSLTDLIRGIRANKKNEQKYIAACLQEIHQEIRSNDPDIKAQAVSKLTYLQMLGYDMSWASFHVVEVMSSAKFFQKLTGYLAATQSFRQDTDILMLTTNLLKKDLASGNHLEVGIALNGLSHIVTPDLARDLCQDLVSMLSHSRPYVRKKVVLVLYKLFLKFPEALRLSFPRLKERLDDSDPSVICAVVNVICELARKNPKNYLSLAPQLFKLLNTSSNNWMLIKIIKLFGALAPLEPRLAKKLLPPITQQIQTTAAMSLLYECIHTVIIGGILTSGGNSDALAAMCVNKLRIFLEDPDQNLKYVGLLALSKILPTYPKLVAENRDIILKCIDDHDISIRLRALDLVVGMVNKKNLTDIVKRLMSHLLPSNNNNESSTLPSTLLEPAYRADIINRIIFICSQNSYSNIVNFEWYIAVLVDLTSVAGINVGDLLTMQIMDVGIRVKSVRQYCVKAMQRLLSDSNLLENCKFPESNSEPGVTKLPHNVQAVYIQSSLKVYAFWANSLTYNWDEDSKQELLRFTEMIKNKISMFCSCTDLEVQERAYNAREIFSIIHQNLSMTSDTTYGVGNNIYASTNKSPSIISELYPLFFSYELNPVAPKAQKKVPVPEGLDLDAWINEPLPESENNESEEEEESYGHGYTHKFGGSGDLIFSSGSGTAIGRRRGRKSNKKGYDSEEDEETKEKRRKERNERIKNDPFYISSTGKDLSKHSKSDKSDNLSKRIPEEIDVDSIPVVRLTMDEFTFKTDKKTSKKSKASKKEKRHSPPPVPPVIYTDIGEMPENATLSDEEKDTTKTGHNKPVWNTIPSKSGGILDVDFSGVSNVDLSTPLGADEKFPSIAVYLAPEEVRRREEERVRRRVTERRIKQTQESTSRVKKNKSEKPKSKVSIEITPNTKSAEDNGEQSSKSKKVPKKKRTGETEDRKKKGKKDKGKKPKKKNSISDNATLEHNDNDVVVDPIKTLVDSDDIQVLYTLRLGSSTEAKNEAPAMIADFTVRNNCSYKHPLSKLTFAFESTTDIQFNKALIEIGELQHGEQKSVTIEFKVLGIVGAGLTVSGNITYEIQSDEETKTNRDIPIRFELPMAVFMLNMPKITPEEFKSCVSQTGDFPFTGSTSIRLNASINLVEHSFQNDVIRLISMATGTHIVEQVPGAITIYGRSVQGYQVAGLAKLTVEKNLMLVETEIPGSVQNTSVRIELKCTDQAFVDGLIREIDYLFRKDL